MAIQRTAFAHAVAAGDTNLAGIDAGLHRLFHFGILYGAASFDTFFAFFNAFLTYFAGVLLHIYIYNILI